jgi:hypothetical protein
VAAFDQQLVHYSASGRSAGVYAGSLRRAMRHRTISSAISRIHELLFLDSADAFECRADDTTSMRLASPRGRHYRWARSPARHALRRRRRSRRCPRRVIGRTSSRPLNSIRFDTSGGTSNEQHLRTPLPGLGASTRASG